jgi:hypothetical protein
MTTNSIKITEEELIEIRKLQEQYQFTQFEFGKLYLEKMEVEEIIRSVQQKEVKLQDKWKNLHKSQEELTDKLLKKYGEGGLDLKEGLFIPDKKEDK